ncbi:hypothetical protein CB1_000873003 [Camelus ferus]|nr:hypothetical protein CB1_000873003 [Camelus ferus]
MQGPLIPSTVPSHAAAHESSRAWLNLRAQQRAENEDGGCQLAPSVGLGEFRRSGIISDDYPETWAGLRIPAVLTQGPLISQKTSEAGHTGYGGLTSTQELNYHSVPFIRAGAGGGLAPGTASTERVTHSHC